MNKTNRRSRAGGWAHYRIEAAWAYLFIAPAFLCLAVFHLFPAAASLVLSFTKWNGLTAPVFNGLLNYAALLKDKEFIQSILHTATFSIVTVPVSVVLATALAVLLNRKMKGVSLYRVMYFLPVVTMSTAVGMIWKWLYNAEFGPINYILGWLHLPQPNWISDPAYTMLSIMIVFVWSTVGYNMVILLAGLQGISGSYYEAARMDGASARYLFFGITLPLLSPSLFFVLMISVIHALQVFDLVFVMTGGNAALLEATRTVVYNMYDQGFVLFRMGYASAQAVVLFVLIFAMTLVQMALQRKWVHYQ
ncbi:carbohydrate ABC transporter permease [Paenibacillus chitinolyticus]|uniref:carbohydrate ABC transporter permease n=1 Tax=Paenibacillus chitinolyticus TaxID=79263 RepID=UPI001C490459|nr:sugar ABC transporter permease [Paenibacillus chitinolyticus]MBV6712185.1 sugar ABC transporter permease [Paenibacillus chitinolyticus]